MADQDAAEDAILDGIVKAANTNLGWPMKARAMRDLAEAWAWMTSPAQPHGGHADSDS